MRNVVGAVLVALALVGPGVSAAKDKPQAAGKTATPKEGEAFTLKKGETKTLSFPGLTRVAVGDPEIADVVTGSGDTLRVKGGTPGKTTLLVWAAGGARKSYLIEVK
jgi:pilus assembly protein CpaC